MVPLVASALIGGVGSLLSGIFGGLGKKQEIKEQTTAYKTQKGIDWDYWKKQNDVLQSQKAANTTALKPSSAYYNFGQNNSQMDYMYQNALLNWIKTNGLESKLGLNVDDLLKTIGLNKPLGESRFATNTGATNSGTTNATPAPTVSQPMPSAQVRPDNAALPSMMDYLRRQRGLPSMGGY
jgi:hypothetical protein